MSRRRSKAKVALIAIVVFVVVAVGVFLGVQFFTKTGIFRIPGVVYYDESLSSEELSDLHEIFDDETVDLDKDVNISARYELKMPELSDNEFLAEILVPVTNFYSTATNVAISEVAELFDASVQTEQDFKLISVDELSFNETLLAINNKYYLDEFDEGAVYRIVKFESEKYEEEVAPLIAELYGAEFPEAEMVLTFAQTGVTAFSRLMNAKMNAVGDGKYFAENIGKFLSGFDLTHTSNEASFSDRVSTSGATGTPICADQRFKATLLAIGLDIVELTGNHNLDCGDAVARETVDFYKENGIKIVGGGSSAEEAEVPLAISKKGTAITMLAFNQSTGGATYDSTPGANQYYEEVARRQISEAKARGDFVIVDMQYYECNDYDSVSENTTCDYADSSAGDQVGLFRKLIDMGADMVVGTSAHQPQTFELYHDGVIYYGLGNLFFDQTKWPGTTRSLVLAHYFYNGKLLQTRIRPTVYDITYQTKLMDEETAKWFIGRLASERP